MISQRVIDLIPPACVGIAGLLFSFQLVTDGSVEKTVDDFRGKVSDRSLMWARVTMYGIGYGFTILFSVLLGSVLLRAWQAYQS